MIRFILYLACAVAGAMAALRPRSFVRKKNYDSRSLATAVRTARVCGLMVAMAGLFLAARELLALI